MMKTLIARRLLVAVGLCALLALPAWSATDEQDDTTAEMTLKDVKNRLKENERHLKEARKQGRAGDAPGMEIALENYSRGMEGLNRALAEGRFNGSEHQYEEAFERVERATRKHGEVLADLYDRVPEQARPAIARAQEVSQRGRETALENLTQARERRAAERGQAGRPDFPGRPSGAGAQGQGPGGPPAGAGAGRPGGGPPSGGAGRPRGGRP
jgi:hypothetical protein